MLKSLQTALCLKRAIQQDSANGAMPKPVCNLLQTALKRFGRRLEQDKI